VRARQPSARSAQPTPIPTEALPARAQVPNFVKDPVWSLRPWPLEVRSGAQTFTVPALCATDWLQYLLRADPDFDGLLLDILPGVEDQLWAEEVSLNQVYELLMDIVGSVSGRAWWIALRLISVAFTGWHIVGPSMIKSGFDPNTLSLAAWLDGLLMTVLENMSPQDTTMFIMRLEIPPAGIEADIEKDLEMDRGAFLSLGGAE
jgi:hypothetical protein